MTKGMWGFIETKGQTSGYIHIINKELFANKLCVKRNFMSVTPPSSMYEMFTVKYAEYFVYLSSTCAWVALITIHLLYSISYSHTL